MALNWQVLFYFRYVNALQITTFKTPNAAIKIVEDTVRNADTFINGSNNSFLSDAQSMEADDEWWRGQSGARGRMALNANKKLTLLLALYALQWGRIL